MVKLERIEVYDPKSDGLDYKTFVMAHQAAAAINPKAAEAILEGLQVRVLNSPVGTNGTLREFLYGERRFFTKNHGIIAVLFMDGRFHSRYDAQSRRRVDLEEMAREANAIPFIFEDYATPTPDLDGLGHMSIRNVLPL